MKKIILVVLLCLIPFLCDAQQIIVTKKKAGGACTHSAAGTLLVGSSTEGAGAAAMPAGWANFINADYTATWAGDCTTETMATIDVFVRVTSGGTLNCKAFVTNSDGTIVTNGISNALGMEWEEAATWHTFTMGTPPTLTKSTAYKLAFICDAGDYEFGFVNTGAVSYCGHENSYASPTTISCGYEDDTSAAIGSIRGKK
jgi:hypothetical protein